MTTHEAFNDLLTKGHVNFKTYVHLCSKVDNKEMSLITQDEANLVNLRISNPLTEADDCEACSG